VRATPAVLVLALAPLAGACGGDDPEVGEVVRGREPVTGTTTSVALPSGALDVVVGAPRDSLAAEDTNDLEEQPEFDGSSWLPVSWSFDPFGGPWGGALAVDPQEAEVALTVDGRSYAVGAPYQVAGPGTVDAPYDDLYVLVPGEPDPEDVGVEVTYDGHPVAGLDELGAERPPGVPCPAGAFETSEPAELDCEISLVGRTPYYPGVGWADDGELLTVVGVRAVRLLSAASRSVVAIEDRSTIAGVTPLVGLTQEDRPQEYVAAGTLVAATPADARGPLVLDLVFTLDDGSTVEATGTVPLA
jgi:hypothetical protein